MGEAKLSRSPDPVRWRRLNVPEVSRDDEFYRNVPGVNLGAWQNWDRAYDAGSGAAGAGQGDKADPGVMRQGTVSKEPAALVAHVDGMAAVTENEERVQA